ncbi:MAG: preprotein translocase subunit SecF [Candidatus Aenigmarchaeota archaeon]|nr:preprotein translocase subunit SecF [Candidatus Aenigmarchaeota archaeon]
MSLSDWTLKNYIPLLALSMLMLAFFVGYLANKQITTGNVVALGVDFRGGTQITFDVPFAPDAKELESLLSQELGANAKVKILRGLKTTVSLETSLELETDDAIAIIDSAGITYSDISVQRIGAALGASFYAQAKRAIFLALIFMAAVVFITFRSIVPSTAVVLAALSDISAALFGMNIAGIELSLASLAGLLILIGYSVDTDILLSTRLLKRGGGESIDKKIKSAMGTGLTMTTCALVSVFVLYLVSTSVVLDQIALVILFGLIADLPFTWFQNVGIMKMYMLRKNAR